jgi:hypothetical protein
MAVERGTDPAAPRNAPPAPAAKVASTLRRRGVAVAGLIGTLLAGWAVSFLAPGVWAAITRAMGRPAVVVSTAVQPVRAARTDLLPPGFVFPRPVEELPPAPAAWDQHSAWADGLGGVDAGSTVVEIVVQGRGSTPVILQDLRVEVLERRPPLVGTYLLPAGADLVDVRYLTADLDGNPPQLTLGEGFVEGAGGWSFPLRVSAQEVEVLYLIARTAACDCSWVAELDYVAQGNAGHLRIDDGGRPFRTTATTNAVAYQLAPDGGYEPVEVPSGA